MSMTWYTNYLTKIFSCKQNVGNLWCLVYQKTRTSTEINTNCKSDKTCYKINISTTNKFNWTIQSLSVTINYPFSEGLGTKYFHLFSRSQLPLVGLWLVWLVGVNSVSHILSNRAHCLHFLYIWTRESVLERLGTLGETHMTYLHFQFLDCLLLLP